MRTDPAQPSAAAARGRIIVLLFLTLVAATCLWTPWARADLNDPSVDTAVNTLAVSPNGNWILVGPDRLYPELHFVGSDEEFPDDDAARRRRRLYLPGVTRGLATFTRDSRHVAFADAPFGKGGVVYVLDVVTGDLQFHVDCRSRGARSNDAITQIRGLSAGVTPTELVVVRRNGLAVWDARTGEELRTSRSFRGAHKVSFSNDCAVSAALHGRHVSVLDGLLETSRFTVDGHSSEGRLKSPRRRRHRIGDPQIRLGALSADGEVLVVLGHQQVWTDPEDDGTSEFHRWIEALDAKTGDHLWHEELSSTGVTAISEAGGVLTFAEEKKVHVRDLRTGSRKGGSRARSTVRALASHDGETWWYGTSDGQVDRL